MPKMKTHRGTAKRFRVTGSGKIMRSKAFKSHIMTKKSQKRKRNFRHETEVAKAAAQLRRPCIASLVMCGIAFVINAIFFYFNFTALLGMMESGEFAELVAGAGSSAAGTSTWG